MATTVNLPACPYCGCRQEPVVIDTPKGQEFDCPECSYRIASWKRTA